MNRLSIIQQAIDELQGTSYLEIGVQRGLIIDNVSCKKRVGVDPDFRFWFDLKIRHTFGLTGFKTFEETSDEFFEKHAEAVLKGGVDVAFVDGLHTYEQSLKDVENSLEYLNDGGVIIMHDCNPLNYAAGIPTDGTITNVKELAAKGELPGWNNVWNGDVWKTILDLRINRPDLDVITVDLDHGLGVVKKRKTSTPVPEHVQKADPKTVDYSFLEAHRQDVLNLQTPKSFREFVR